MSIREIREARTPAQVIWNESLSFLDGALMIAGPSSAKLFLACHSLELALKAHLRAKGWAIEQLTKPSIRHDIGELLAACEKTGMSSLPRSLCAQFTRLAEAHVIHEYRYAFEGFRRDPTEREFANVTLWALHGASTAVAPSSSSRLSARLRKLYATHRRKLTKPRLGARFYDQLAALLNDPPVP